MGEEIMEYIDRQQDIRLTDEDYKEINALRDYLYNEKKYTNSLNLLNNIYYRNGLRVETFSEPEYKDLPVDWVLALFQ